MKYPITNFFTNIKYTKRSALQLPALYLSLCCALTVSPILLANPTINTNNGFNTAAAIVAPKNKLGRGLNFGGTMEAFEGGIEGGLVGDDANSYTWGYPLKADYFATIKKAGFQHVRLPISWSMNKPPSMRYSTLTVAPYTISSELFARVDWAVQQALKNGLAIIIDNHNPDDPIHKDPVAEEERFLSIWQQIAEHYKNQPNSVYFELLNEPTSVLGQDPILWNALLNKTLQVIRQTNPNRPIIVGGVSANSAWTLPNLQLPKNDPNLIATFHFYDPFSFTHQGASWVNPPLPTGVTWTGTTLRLVPGMTFGVWHEQTKWSLKPSNTLALNFTAWGGLYFSPYINLVGFNALSFKTNKAGLRLGVLCNDPDTTPTEDYYTITTLKGLRTYTVNFKDCAGSDVLRLLRIANYSDQPVTGVNLQDMALTGPLGRLPLVATELAQIQTAFDYVTAWAKLNNRPVHIGEFGTYEKSEGVGASAGKARANWAKTMRQEAEKRGFSWSYWDFASGGECNQQIGFGIYIRAINRPGDCIEPAKWKTHLLNALTR
ncbi:glycoside hydrolase family 5 protein [Crenothrix polyspora]|uniref:Glycoside hydrolase family 5 domain-containing protein n=1 Tax=Crenothrix polyspora TaxID=360316 RepID=A0A1R4HBD2_9GAMM|nr:glycoside hydrolase family 5 protein [Crenothrix polyspora]SJM93545.1 hypothetical protein CRENPOLYSF1_440020 [Crenothrix polyspora]